MTALTTSTEDSLEILPVPRAVVLPRVNLLPPEVGEQRALRRLQVGLAGVVVVAMGVVGGLEMHAASGVSSAQASVDSAQQQSVTLQRQIKKLSNVTTTRNEYEAAQAALTAALGQEIRWSRYLNDLSITLPNNVWVTNVAVTQGAGATGASPAAAPASGNSATTGLGTVTISGVALSLNDVATWLETLAKEHGYTNPYLTSSSAQAIGTQNVVNFTSTVTVSSDALSHRYTNQAGN